MIDVITINVIMLEESVIDEVVNGMGEELK